MTKSPPESDPAADNRGDDETRKLNAFLDSVIDNIPAMVFVKDAKHLRYEARLAAVLDTGGSRG
jgi:hypothetical protein